MATETQAAGGVGAQTLEGNSLLEEILAETKMTPGDEAYEIAKRGVQAFIAELVTPKREGEKIDKALVDAMISEIDAKLSRQVDEILHDPSFQKLESAWRGLKFLIDRTDFRENVKIELLNCSKEDLLNDFEDAPEVVKSGLYKTVYSAEFGQFGGKPYGAIVSNYDFGPGPQDIALLQKCAAVATMAHAPFLAAAGPQFFGLKDYLNLPNLKDLKALFEGPQYTKYNSFRETEDSRYVGLLMPRFLLRLPYGVNTVPTKGFNYEEDVVGNHDRYLWGNATYAFATRLADSFAKFRWCPNVIGPQAGGAVENLPLHQYEAMGEIQTKCPTEIYITDRREFELSEEGFIALTFRKDSDNACFFSANSVQKPKYFGQSEEGRAAELNYRLGTQLPYMFIICRLAHYLKVLQREQIGSWKERIDLERELNDWIGQYVADQDVVSPTVRSRRPLRKAKIIVTEVEGNAGWYKVDMQVRPHFKYMGSFFTLSLVGKLDKE
ncbi:type VI secretion system contractile sheath large subunit [Chondromyces crocatus]|uniref:Type VI secretion protein EvpB n=1 Tax=Chondromyces crocatus TaxID=52 RepID=A0A0K1EDF1_CHOCO|nr:type VI secretion system contractile sheath large subunit [Chondromyces crocatus]AKT38906.1 type VI secretion protein EvpB [Chondromyces crocatus]